MKPMIMDAKHSAAAVEDPAAPPLLSSRIQGPLSPSISPAAASPQPDAKVEVKNETMADATARLIKEADRRVSLSLSTKSDGKQQESGQSMPVQRSRASTAVSISSSSSTHGSLASSRPHTTPFAERVGIKKTPPPIDRSTKPKPKPIDAASISYCCAQHASKWWQRH